MPNGSSEVFASAIPVSKPATLVTNGNSRSQVHRLMSNAARGCEVSPKRGIGSVEEATPTLLSGAKLTLTVRRARCGQIRVVSEKNATNTGMNWHAPESSDRS